MGIPKSELLQAPLTAHETRWAGELADRLPYDVDLTFEESKILTRIPSNEWPDSLMLKVKNVINIEDFLIENLD
ncbi:MAG: hypothetical protein PHR66_07345 [Desulfuromonadaceae bacterium]|nr:hypothetical protein [Desulfuromonadaceae bacterium]